MAAAAARPYYWDVPINEAPPGAAPAAAAGAAWHPAAPAANTANVPPPTPSASAAPGDNSNASPGGNTAARPYYWDADVGEPEQKPLPARPGPGASQADINAYDRAVMASGQTDQYIKPTVDNSKNVWGHVANGLLTVARGAAIGGNELTDLVAAGIQTAAAQVDKLRGNPMEERREGTSAERWVQENLYQTAAQKQELAGPIHGQDFVDKALLMSGDATVQLAEMILTPGPQKLAEGGRIAQAGYGAVKGQVPAIAHGVEVGREVYERTGDPKAALSAGIAAWGSVTAMSAVPMAAGSGRLTRVATGAGIGAGGAEAQQDVEQASLPPEMRTPESLSEHLESDALGALQGAILTGVTHSAPAPTVRGVAEQPHSVMEHAQAAAAALARADGGDALDQVSAAVHANAAVGAVHDAAAVHAAREFRLQAATEEAANEQALIDQGQREQALNQAEVQKAPAITPEEGFAQAEADQAAQREQDFAAARNQQGDQEVEAAQLAELGRQKGGAIAPKPTLADTLQPEQLAALKSLKDRRAAELQLQQQRVAAVEQQAAAQGREVTVAERLAAAHPEDQFAPLAEEAPGPAEPSAPSITTPDRLQMIREAAQKRAQAATRSTPVEAKPAEAAEPVNTAEPAKVAEPAEEEEAPEGNPPPVTVQTLAERRRAALDKALAAKVRGEPAVQRPAAEDVARMNGPHAVEGNDDRIEYLRSELAATEPGTPDHEALKGELAELGAEEEEAPTPQTLAERRQAAVATARSEQVRARQEALRAPAEPTPMSEVPAGTVYAHGRSPAEAARREAAFQQDAAYKRLMTAPPDDVGAIVGRMAPEEAAAHLDRLNAAPGDNPVARAALEARAAAEEAPSVEQAAPRARLTLADRRAQRRFVAEQKGRSQFADTAQPARPQDVAYARNPDGTHVAETPNGRTTFVERPNGNLQVKSTETGRAMRGAGEGTVRLERGAMEAHTTSGNLESDTRVSAPAQEVYRKLAERGYDVRENPHTVDPGTGEKISASELKGVYEVGPRDLTKLTGMQLKRLAHAGDNAAAWEMERRLNAPQSEPRGGTPEAAPRYVARNRDTGEEVARYDNAADAQEHAERFPQDQVTREPKGALTAKRTLERDTAPGARRGPAVTKEEAARRLQPLVDKVGADRLQVHDSLDDPAVPQNIRDDAQAFNHPDPRGVFDPSTGTMHVFAGAGGHKSVEDAHDTAVHELAHNGVRSFLGDDYSRAMQDIYDNIHDRQSALASPIDGVAKTTAREWIRDYMAQHNFDPRNPRHQEIAADEYVAHLAEHDASDPGQENPSILRRVYDAVRAGLRRLGVVHEWTDNDIRRLLRESNNDPADESEHARAAKEYQGNGLRWADSEDRYAERFPPDHPLAQGHKYALTMEAQADRGRGYVVSRSDALGRVNDFIPDSVKDKWDSTKGGMRSLWLAMVPRRNIADHVSMKWMAATREYNRVVQQMQGRRGQLLAADAPKLLEWHDWAQKNPGLAARLDDLMHESTLAGTDPSKPFENRYSDEDRAKSPAKAAADAARRAYYLKKGRPDFNAIGEHGQEIYRTIRDAYKQRRAQFFDALKQRSRELGISESSHGQLMSLLRQKFEAGRVQEPYFPLARWGDRFSVAKDAEGNVVSYSRFESRAQQQAWEAAMRTDGYKVNGGKDVGNDRATAAQVDPAFVSKVIELTKEAGGDSSLADEIYQHYLATLPDRSYRKIFMHRTGRLGFAANARRAFADQSQRSARAIASLEYNHRLDAKLAEVRAQKDALEDAASQDPRLQNEADWGASVLDRMTKDHAWVKNPSNARWANLLTGVGFHYFLGWNPATAIRIHTQQYMNALPWLAARHGQLGAARELGLAMQQFARAHGSLGDTLRGDERRAFDEANASGVFQNTFAHTMTQAAKGDVMRLSDPNPVRKTAATVAMTSQYLFNGVENFNRQSTYLAAFRLAIKQGKSYDEAVQHAINASQSTHFDYSPENRPAILRSNIAKVAGLFAQYSVNQMYRLARDFRDGVLRNPAISVEERNAAAKTFAGMMGYGALFFGAGGALSPVFGTLNALLGSHDDPLDSKAATHEYLRQHVGQFLANAIMDGPISAATHASFASTGYWDLFYRAPSHDSGTPDNALQRFLSYVPVISGLSQGGPWGQLASDLYRGGDLLHRGEIERALEHFAPLGLRGPLKAARYATHGVENPGTLPVPNAQIMPRSELSPADLAVQAAGLTPEALANRYEENTAKENAVQAVYGTPATRGARAQILHHFALALGHHDDKEIAKAIEEATAFNAANPEAAINSDAIAESVRAQYKNAALEEHGVLVPLRLRAKLDKLYGRATQSAEAAQ